MTADEYLTFYYPFFADATDPRKVDAGIRANALAEAQKKAPLCDAVTVGSDLQNEAVAHYAAYLLLTRYEQIKAGSGVIAGMVLKREKEGDVEREWTAQTNLELDNQVLGPNSPYERYQAIANLCPVTSPFRLRTKRI